jgi:hypothetical protein
MPASAKPTVVFPHDGEAHGCDDCRGRFQSCSNDFSPRRGQANHGRPRRSRHRAKRRPSDQSGCGRNSERQSRYCPMPGKVPMPLLKIVSITSSAPPAMEARRPSRKARLTGVSFM